MDCFEVDDDDDDGDWFTLLTAWKVGNCFDVVGTVKIWIPPGESVRWISWKTAVVLYIWSNTSWEIMISIDNNNR